MGRAPCCEKTGLKKGPWTAEEDRILVSFIQNHGHTNWRALPKKAGLLRCGKSCRLRWINYLRPDIKRGNFTEEEENTIIQLHEALGNRWSEIAASLPGRTDNEIKNVWHTNLKKKLSRKDSPELDSKTPKRHSKATSKKAKTSSRTRLDGRDRPSNIELDQRNDQNTHEMSSSLLPNNQDSSSDDTNSTKDFTSMVSENTDSVSETFLPIDDDLWLNLDFVEDPGMSSPLDSLGEIQSQRQFITSSESMESSCYPPGFGPSFEDDYRDFWYDVFLNAGGMEEML